MIRRHIKSVLEKYKSTIERHCTVDKWALSLTNVSTVVFCFAGDASVSFYELGSFYWERVLYIKCQAPDAKSLQQVQSAAT